MEGVYVPLRNDYHLPDGPFVSPEVELTRYFEGPKYSGSGATTGVDSVDADFIDSLFARVGLGTVLSVDRSRLHESHEAWIHILISCDEAEDVNLAVFSGFTPYPRRGVFTWHNSD
jgi:hypothetical protein